MQIYVSETSEELLVAFYLMWFFGAILLLQAIRWDIDGAWSDLPYLVNLASTLTAALLGVPVAVLFTQKLARAQASFVRRSDVGTITRDVTFHLLNDLNALCPQGLSELSLLSSRGELLLEKFALRNKDAPSFEEFRDHMLKLSQTLPKRDVVEDALDRVEHTVITYLPTLRTRFEDVKIGWIDAQFLIDHVQMLANVRGSLDDIYGEVKIAQDWIFSGSADFDHISIPGLWNDFNSHMQQSDSLVREWCDFLLATQEIATRLQRRVGH